MAVGGGTAVAGKMITGDDVKNGTLTGKDVDNGSLKTKDIANNGVKSIDLRDGSITGTDIQDGSVGASDLAAGAVPDSLEVVADRLTPKNAALYNLNVVDAPALPRNSGGPTSSQGTPLFDSVELEEGTYLVEGTVQFFDFTPDSDGTEYGVAKVFVEGDAVATLWSSDVPDDGNNAAQTSGSSLLDIPAGGATLSVRAAMRTDEGDGGQAGGNLVVTRIP